MADQLIINVRIGFRNHYLDSFRRSEEVSIYKVPEFLVKLNPSAYFPQMVSLGPLHHHVPHPEMLPHKLHAMRKRFDISDEEKVIGDVLALAPEVRKCYQHNIEYEDEYPSRMLTLDACFILQIFRALDIKTKSDHCLFNRKNVEYTAYPIISNILMLENQIPLSVLLKILGLQLNIDDASAFTELSDLVDCARIAKLFYSSKKAAPQLSKIPGAEKYDICVISRYVHVMCELIHSERDVSVLRKAEIIKSYKGSDREVADLFKTLSKGIPRSYKDPFAKVTEDADKHYHSKIKVMIAEFTDDHCSRPWRTVSVIAACMLLLFTAVQAIFSLHLKPEAYNAASCRRRWLLISLAISTNLLSGCQKATNEIIYFRRIIKSYLGSDREAADLFKTQSKDNLFSSPWRTVSVMAACLIQVKVDEMYEEWKSAKASLSKKYEDADSMKAPHSSHSLPFSLGHSQKKSLSVGLRLLTKMGYKGKGIGIHGHGMVEPVKVEARPRYARLGYGEGEYSKALDAKNSLKEFTIAK
ncbi:uncharacterized protein LOC131858518 [Cryptomeria japonica]|uniref:uncharacterized protein LOC131858518 n=1 Tax=Cryptomeria japonica TaxID=3369 RepID=UPI0027D9EFA4|nr:uncharacterized protein LOC131858518 [Cryptomeria japonica]